MKKIHLVHIGSFGSSVGLKGEIKITIYFFEYEILKNLISYLLDEKNRIWNFQYLKNRNNKLIGKLQECDSINCAEKLKGRKIFIDKDNIPKVKKNHFYIFDLIDCEVKTSNNKLLGNIINIDNFGAGDLINVKKTNDKSFYIPMNEDNIINIDINKKVVIVNPIKGMLD